MVVESDASLRDALAYHLEAEGFAVVLCASGELLLSMALPKDRAVIVIDEALPGAAGSAVIFELRRRGVSLPLILTVNDPSPGLLRSAARAGAAVVEKPLVNDALVSQIRAAFDLKT
ncbi:MAG: response regulator transcription factor [Proteobacteria bacterium]|nr:response regulator transcription factor [Pseudomonadota bacterium]